MRSKILTKSWSRVYKKNSRLVISTVRAGNKHCPSYTHTNTTLSLALPHKLL